jgi:acetyltransferase-like isoleucine patch superfamily enzyme
MRKSLHGPRAGGRRRRPPAARLADVFVHPSALVESDNVGEGTRIWAFAHVLKGARIGKGCNIGDHCFVEGAAVLGDRVTLKNGVAVWDGVTIQDDAFLGPNAVLTNDPVPRAEQILDFRAGRARFVPTPTRIGRGASVGANATIVCGVTIGEHALVGAGSVVTSDVPPYALVYGVPARVHGHVCTCGRRLHATRRCACGRRFIRRSGGGFAPVG